MKQPDTLGASSTPPEVVVVGGGVAGLSVACYLARAGRSVILYEKARHLGGRAATECSHGYAFNRGGHAFYTGGAATQALQELGIAYRGQRPGANFALIQGTLQTFPTSTMTLLRTHLLSGADKLEFARLFATLPRFTPATLRQMSVEDWLDQCIQRPRVRQVLSASARTLTYTAALDQVSADVFILQAQLALKHPIVYLDGGWQTLIDALREAVEQAGVHIFTGTRVEAVVYQEGRVEGVHLGTGETVRASAVVVAASPREASALVDGGAHPALRTLAQASIPVQIACLDVALRRLPPPPHYPVILDLDQPRFLTFQSLTARIAPPGGGLIHTFKYLDPAHPTDPHEDECDLEQLLDTAQPGWREQVVTRRFLPRIAAINRLVTAAGGGLRGRPSPEVAGIAGLSLVGDWIGAEGYLVDASLASARQVVQRLLHQPPDATRFRVMIQARAV